MARASKPKGILHRVGESDLQVAVEHEDVTAAASLWPWKAWSVRRRAPPAGHPGEEPGS